MGQSMKYLTLFLQFWTAPLTLVGIGLTFAGMFEADWLVAEDDRPAYRHGLWKNCKRSDIADQKDIKPIGDWICLHKIDRQNMDDPFKPWEIQILCLLGSANGVALIALLILIISFCRSPLCTILWALFSFAATALSAAGIVLFYRWSNESENKFFQILLKKVEQRYGESFWFVVGGCLIYSCATVLAISCSVITFVNRTDSHSRQHPAPESYSRKWSPTRPKLGRDTVV